MAKVLDLINDKTDLFLSEAEVDAALWRWLEVHPGSVALSLFPASPEWAAVMVMRVDGAGRQQCWILGIFMPPQPVSSAALVEHLRAVPDAQAATLIEQLAAWLREFMVLKVEQFLGAQPSCVLWSPPPELRCVPPGAIWLDRPVALAASLTLVDAVALPSRPRSTLLTLADPGPCHEGLDLREHGLRALETLRVHAEARGPVHPSRALGSVMALHCSAPAFTFVILRRAHGIYCRRRMSTIWWCLSLMVTSRAHSMLRCCVSMPLVSCNGLAWPNSVSSPTVSLVLGSCCLLAPLGASAAPSPIRAALPGR